MLTRTTLTRVAATLTIAATIAACSGSVETQGGTGASASGSGGSSSTTANGGAAATSSVGQGGGGAFCGGKAGIPCAPDEYCAFDPPGGCGNADGGGKCMPRPMGCTADCPGVCGCDGAFYCNACGANAAGVDTSSASTNTCLPDAGSPAIYSASEIFTDVPRFAIYKADPTRDVCFRIVVEGLSSDPSSGIATPVGWSTGLLEVTNHASDCVPGANGYPAPPIAAAVKATGSSGKIDFLGGGPSPCTVTIHASLTFPKTAPFVPMSESFDADNLFINGACPP